MEFIISISRSPYMQSLSKRLSKRVKRGSARGVFPGLESYGIQVKVNFNLQMGKSFNFI